MILSNATSRLVLHKQKQFGEWIMSLFDKFCGFSAVSKVVGEFYDELEQNPVTAPYFTGMNMEKLIEHQVKFLSQALGGPQQYSGMAMNAAHKNLAITEDAFNDVAKTLSDILEDNDIEPADIGAIMELAGSLKEQVVTA